MKYKESNPENWWKKWGVENKELIKKIHKHVEKNGPTSSSEFKREKKVEGWWDWKKEKMALEYLFNEGKLMVAYRRGFKKYYELPENVLPDHISTEPYPEDNLANRMIEIIFSSLGIASSEELKTFMGRAYMKLLWNNNKNEVGEFLTDCVKNDLLTEVRIPEVQNPHYVLSKNIPDLEKTNSDMRNNQPMKFLSPFDNLVRERDYPKRFWDFDYKIECYTPVAQRIFGYFSLPILDGSQLIGRTDLKVHRKEGILEIKSLHFESGIKLDEELLQRFKEGLSQFANFHNCHDYLYDSMQPIKHKGKIKSLFL